MNILIKIYKQRKEEQTDQKISKQTRYRISSKMKALKINTIENQKKIVVGPLRFERRTSRLSAVRSTWLSYGPISEH